MPKTLPILLSLPLLAGGCAYHGPGALGLTRPEYNVAIQRTNDQELLLNLVRLRYRDTPYFLGVEKVVSGLEFSRGLSASAANTLGLAGAISFTEKPTLFYAPLEGEKFARQLMTPLPLDTLVLLANSGWSVERVFAVTLQEMNGIRNAPTASGPTPAREPEFRDFRAALRHLRALQMRRGAELGRAPEGNGVALRFATATAGDTDAGAFRRILGLDPALNQYHLVAGLGTNGGDRIAVATRSLIATLNYLSQGVEPPPSDLAAGRVTHTQRDDGRAFDWQEMLAGIFRVRAGSSRPENAAVAVRYRGTWFHIADDDLGSKATFALLAQMLALQGGAGAGTGGARQLRHRSLKPWISGGLRPPPPARRCRLPPARAW